jgi:hypothetical protein
MTSEQINIRLKPLAWESSPTTNGEVIFRAETVGGGSLALYEVQDPENPDKFTWTLEGECWADSGYNSFAEASKQAEVCNRGLLDDEEWLEVIYHHD